MGMSKGKYSQGRKQKEKTKTEEDVKEEEKTACNFFKVGTLPLKKKL